MDLNDATGMLIFLSIFELLGGGAVGIALRGIVPRDFTGCFFLIWGSGFGGIPLIIGAATFLSQEQYGYFFAQLFIFFGAMLTMALLPPDLFQSGGGDSFAEGGPALIGAVFTIIGGGMVLLSFRAGSGLPLVIGGIFAFIGIALVAATAIRLIRTL